MSSRWQWFRTLCAVLGALVLPVGAFAPLSGVPFLSPSTVNFGRIRPKPGLKISRLEPTQREYSDSSCHDGDQASPDKCLTAPGEGCMWTRLETQDPSLFVQASNSYCLPCKLNSDEIPCWSIGAWVGDKVVTDCTMSCPHQKYMQQPGNACSAGVGGTSQSECFERGISSGTKCMFLAFEDTNGQVQSQCGPCRSAGSGEWSCPAVGSAGIGGSKVKSCLSQCDEPCSGPPDCAPTAMPPPVVPASPGVARVDSPPGEMLSAPTGVAGPTPNPMAVVQAAILAAKENGHPFPAVPPPKIYIPVVMYRPPSDYAATTLAPMPSYQNVWPDAVPQDGPVNWPEMAAEATAASNVSFVSVKSVNGAAQVTAKVHGRRGLLLARK